MKKYFYLWLLVLPTLFVSCSSDDDKTAEIEFEGFKIEASQTKIIQPEWLNEVITSQSITSDTGTFFPGDIYGVIVDGKKYIVVNNHISSNSCVALQVYHLDGEALPCSEELQLNLFTGGLDQYPNTLLWSGMVELE